MTNKSKNINKYCDNQKIFLRFLAYAPIVIPLWLITYTSLVYSHSVKINILDVITKISSSTKFLLLLLIWIISMLCLAVLHSREYHFKIVTTKKSFYLLGILLIISGMLAYAFVHKSKICHLLPWDDCFMAYGILLILYFLFRMWRIKKASKNICVKNDIFHDYAVYLGIVIFILPFLHIECLQSYVTIFSGTLLAIIITLFMIFYKRSDNSFSKAYSLAWGNLFDFCVFCCSTIKKKI